MKSLQEWYRQINGIYLDRNFYRSIESIFAHLVEVSRGLAVAATQRRKRELNAEEFLPKALAWWLALCGRAGVPDVENMLWLKFPAVCPYCQLPEHKGKECKEADPAKAEINWTRLEAIGKVNSGKKPKSLAAWQKMFNVIYARDDSTSHETNVNRLAEELGELSEAVRTLPVAPEYFVAEAPDVFAWLMGFANQFDFDRQEKAENCGDRLTRSMEEEYPGHCKLCGRQVCKCPPVPASTLGRIAHEVPTGLVAVSRLFSLQESIHLFKRAEQAVKVGDKTIMPEGDEIHKISTDTQAILSVLQQQADWHPKIAVSLSAAIGGLHRLAEQGEVTQGAVDEIMRILTNLPPENRQQTLGFLNNLAASATFNAIMTTLPLLWKS